MCLEILLSFVMGKKGRSSWFSSLKKAFISRRGEDDEQEEKKTRWVFRKPWNHKERFIVCSQEKSITRGAEPATSCNAIPTSPMACDANNERHAIAVAMATTAAAQAAIATAQAVAEVARLARPCSFVKRHFAALLIQTYFRGYLARKALGGLKGLVKLQALIRGNIVRTRADMTLQCIQSLVRLQTSLCKQGKSNSNRLSFEANSWNNDPTEDDVKTVEIDACKVYSHRKQRQEEEEEEEASYSTLSPRVRANSGSYYSSPRLRDSKMGSKGGVACVPNYMGATASANARSRPRSHRCSTSDSEGEKTVRKRLYFPLHQDVQLQQNWLI